MSAANDSQPSVNAFLLTRQWRDTDRGVQLEYWAASASGPLRLRIESQSAVCFIARDDPLIAPSGSERKPLALRSLQGDDVDGLYFSQQRSLQAFREQHPQLYESDIKPTERYLMERFVNAAMQVSGSMIQRDGYTEVRQINLKPASEVVSLRCASLDIETRAASGNLYSIGVAMPGCDTVFMLADHEGEEHRDDYTLIYCTSEAQVLESFFAWLQHHDPDVLIGWNIVNFDLQTLEKCCQRLRLPFAFGRGGEKATILQPGNSNQMRVARLPGRAVLDGVDLLKAGFWSFESFALDHVAQQMLGDGKLISPNEHPSGLDKVAEINRQFEHDKPMLADYNIQDCRLVNRIFEHADLLAFACQRAQMTGLPIDRMGGSVAAFDHLYLPRLHRQGYVAPDIGRDSDGPASPGGYVLDSRPGLYENVLVLDFKSLYPSIIRTFFIDPLGLALGREATAQDVAVEDASVNDVSIEADNVSGTDANADLRASPENKVATESLQPASDNTIPGFHGANFAREGHILPDLITALWAERDRAKQERNAALSQAIKIIMNSFYGVLGSSGCRFHHHQLASSITLRGHEIINRSRELIEATGHPVIYGDTDSLFVLLEGQLNEDRANEIGNELMHMLNQWWRTHLRTTLQLESQLEVEYETHYLRFLMPTVRGLSTGSKKRYAGMIRNNGETQLVFKGLEAVRTDWTPLARDFQRELFRRVFNDEPYEDFVRDMAQDLRDGKYDQQLVYRKRLRRSLADYQRNVPPHVQAARKLRKSGNWISYVITRNGPEPVAALESAPDYDHYLDKQLAPAADSILHFLDTSFRQITDAQMQMF